MVDWRARHRGEPRDDGPPAPVAERAAPPDRGPAKR